MSAPDWPVPYITMRDGEEAVPESMLGIRYNRAGSPDGICYEWELSRDRDDRGVLWARTSQNRSPETGRPAGKPLFAAMHPARQREMMSALRCHVCGQQASKTEQGWLFLVLASQLLRRLTNVTVVDIDRELEAAGKPPRADIARACPRPAGLR